MTNSLVQFFTGPRAHGCFIIRESTVASAVHNKLTNLRVTSHPHLLQHNAGAIMRGTAAHTLSTSAPELSATLNR